jgi:hypothetical protein
MACAACWGPGGPPEDDPPPGLLSCFAGSFGPGQGAGITPPDANSIGLNAPLISLPSGVLQHLPAAPVKEEMQDLQVPRKPVATGAAAAGVGGVSCAEPVRLSDAIITMPITESLAHGVLGWLELDIVISLCAQRNTRRLRAKKELASL